MDVESGVTHLNIHVCSSTTLPRSRHLLLLEPQPRPHRCRRACAAAAVHHAQYNQYAQQHLHFCWRLPKPAEKNVAAID